jgi:pimeloyl-[acyl-carrier protein] methyl ester esterase
MLHGWGMNARVFEPLLAALDPGLAVINPGLPGYADSPWGFEASFDSQLRQMGRDLPPGRLLGWSMGGLYAIELALRHPEKFSELILVASNPCFVTRSGWNCAIDSAVLDTFAEDMQLDRRRTLRRFLALQMQGESDARAITRDLWQRIAEAGEPDLAVLRFGLDLLRHQDLRDAMSQLQQPVSLILGERDKLVPIELLQQIPDVAPGIRVESVAGAAHAPFISNPDAIVAELQAGASGNQKF